jgi:hypothetical protein
VYRSEVVEVSEVSQSVAKMNENYVSSSWCWCNMLMQGVSPSSLLCLDRSLRQLD